MRRLVFSINTNLIGKHFRPTTFTHNNNDDSHSFPLFSLVLISVKISTS